MKIHVDPSLPTYRVTGSRVTYENPGVLVDDVVVYREATIEIDTTNMRQEFLLWLMHYLSKGDIRVKIARLKEQQ